jgi:hypothetical protein
MKTTHSFEYVKRFLDSEYPNCDVYFSQLSMELATNFEYFVRNNPIKAHDPLKAMALLEERIMYL